MSGAPVPPLAGHGHIALTEAELRDWGERFGRQLRAPAVVTLAGDLGAGKTTLVQAICRGLGVTGDVTSPTFALVHEYEGRGATVYHLDLYRLQRESELEALGWDDILAADGVVLVEWPERAAGLIPRDHIPIRLEHLPDDSTRRALYAGGHVGAQSFGGDSA